MPYIPAAERPELETLVNRLADEIVAKLVKDKLTAHISVLYEESILKIIDNLYGFEIGKKTGNPTSTEQEVAIKAFELSRHRDYDCPWLGELDYSLTRLIQLVPRKMEEKGAWEDELRYWIFAQTCGALERVVFNVSKRISLPDHAYILNGVIGAVLDTKDEYKRRVGSAYEAVQIRKSGDCYDGAYRTELEDVKDADGNVIGYSEIMKDFRKNKVMDKKVE